MYKITQSNNRTYVERTIAPRFKAEVTFSASSPSDLGPIQWIDPEPPASNFMQIARYMREAGDFIANNSK